MLGASFDTPEENRAFADDQRFGFQLLSDVDRRVGAAYEVKREPDSQGADYPRRLAYLIDPEGVIRKAYDVKDVGSFAAEVLTDLAALRA